MWSISTFCMQVIIIWFLKITLLLTNILQKSVLLLFIWMRFLLHLCYFDGKKYILRGCGYTNSCHSSRSAWSARINDRGHADNVFYEGKIYYKYNRHDPHFCRLEHTTDYIWIKCVISIKEWFNFSYMIFTEVILILKKIF